jgi:AcrR family transcriptional regulator
MLSLKTVGAKKQPLTTSERVLKAAADLLRKGGVDAISTRAVAAAAGVQPPTLYRQFGDKDGLLDAVTVYVLQSYVLEKRRAAKASGDPVADLHQLWDLHVDFGLAQPECYVLAYGQSRPGKVASAATETTAILREVIARIGDHGRLRMSVDRATSLFHSCGVGFMLTQLAMPEGDRDLELSSIAYDNAVAGILNDAKPKSSKSTQLPSRAVALREAVCDAQDLPLTPAEVVLLAEWLDRLADYKLRR